MVVGNSFFGEFKDYFHNDVFEGAKFIAFWQNLVMSVSFVVMFWERDGVDGQSFTIGWVDKVVGNVCNCGTKLFAD